jgi:NDMA-dependent alcohol dehydrogenase
MKTRAAVLEEGSTCFKIMELEVPPPGPGEVHVKFVASGLCHSDLHLLDGDIVPRFPIVAGHEGAGIVEEVGPGVTKVKVGDHVVCSFIPACGNCRWCATGHSNLCNNGAYLVNGTSFDGTFRYHGVDGREYGSFSMLGTFSERATLSELSVVKVDEWLPLDIAVLVGCGVPTGWGTAVNAGGVKAGDTAVIYGIGGVGINAVQGAVAAGARFVVVVDPVQFKLDTAMKMGATHAFTNPKEAGEKVNELTWGEGADQALVTVGVVDQEVITDAFNVLGKCGTLVVTGQAHPDKLTINLPSAHLVRYEKVVRGSQYGSCNPQYDIVKLLRMYSQGVLKLDELVTKTYRLDDINEMVQDLRDGKLIRGVIDFS